MRLPILAALSLLIAGPAVAQNTPEPAPAPTAKPAGLPAPESARIIGEYRVPSGLLIDGVAFGGLSGLEYDPETGVFLALSDDRAQRGPARFYRLKLVHDPKRGPDVAIRSLDILGATPITDRDGKPFAAKSVDPEALRRGPDGALYWASEGDAAGRPSLAALTPQGRTAGPFEIPAHHLPTVSADGARSGVRPNRAYEAIAVDADGRVIVGIEGALWQDAPPANPNRGAPVRITVFDPTTRRAVAEHVYPTDPIAARPVPSDGFADAGLVDLLAAPGGGLFALERSFAVGQGNVVKLYRTGFDGATDVLKTPSLAGRTYTPMRKTLIFTFQIGPQLSHVDNLEGLSYGPEIDGKRTLVLVSDDNFNRGPQVTQFLMLLLE